MPMMSLGFIMFAIIACIIALTPILAIVFIIRMIMQRRDDVKLSREEEEQFHRLMVSLQKMEQRIENLETILMHREGPPRFGGQP